MSYPEYAPIVAVDTAVGQYLNQVEFNTESCTQLLNSWGMSKEAINKLSINIHVIKPLGKVAIKPVAAEHTTRSEYNGRKKEIDLYIHNQISEFKDNSHTEIINQAANFSLLLGLGGAILDDRGQLQTAIKEEKRRRFKYGITRAVGCMAMAWAIHQGFPGDVMPIFGGIVTGIPAAESALWLQKRLVGESGTSLYKQANRDLEKFIRDNHHADLIRIDTARNQ